MTRFTDLIAAEWIKVRSLRSTLWTLVLATVVVIGSGVLATGSDPSRHLHTSALSDAFPLVGYMALMLLAASAGAIAVVGEYSSGLIRTTTVAVPARGSVLLAKAVVVTALWLTAGAVMSTASFLVTQAILAGRDASVSITDPGACTALVGATLLAPICALIGLGLGVLIRHTAATMIAGAVLLLIGPLFFPGRRPWAVHVNHAMMLSAWQRLTQTYGPPAGTGALYATFTGSWIVYAVWPLALLAPALVVIRRRDV